MEAWGRKKRSVGKQQAGMQLGDDMTLSREIVVLDLKDKEASGGGEPADEGQPPAGSSSAQKSPLKSAGSEQAAYFASPTGSGASLENSSTKLHCLTSQSLLVLICSIALFFVFYVCVVAYFFARRHPEISPIKHQYH